MASVGVDAEATLGRSSLEARGRFLHLLRFLRKNPHTLAGCVIVIAAVLVMIFSPLFAPYPPERPYPAESLQPPSLRHLMGTDNSGMDVFSRVLYATRIDLSIALAAVALSILIGTPLGVIAGYFGRALGEVIMRISDLIQSFPLFILAMSMVAITGQNIQNLIYVLAFLNTPIYVRLMRSETLSVKERTYVEAARVAGLTNLSIMTRHVLPNSVTSVFIQASVTIGWSILLTAGLSFVGAGVRVPTPEWGLMVAIGAPNILTGEWWPSVFPGAAIAVAVLGFALVGDGLQRLYGERKG